MKDIKINYLNNIYHIKTYEDINSFLYDNNIKYTIDENKSIISNLRTIFDLEKRKIKEEITEKLLKKTFIYINEVKEMVSNVIGSNVELWLDYNFDDYDLACNIPIGFDIQFYHIIYATRKNGKNCIIDILTK